MFNFLIRNKMALLTPLVALTASFPASAVDFSPEQSQEPLIYLVNEIAPILDIDAKKRNAQIDFAHKKGHLQYTLGTNALVRQDVIRMISKAYGPPDINTFGHMEWRVGNETSSANAEKHDTIVIGIKHNGSYFLKAECAIIRSAAND